MAPDGSIQTDKLLSENPAQYKDAAIEGIRRLLAKHNIDVSQQAPFLIKMGTTVATNALLERKGDATLLVMTQGFADALRIGYQHRPELFALKITLPEMLYKQVLEAQERLSATGEVLITLNKANNWGQSKINHLLTLLGRTPQLLYLINNFTLTPINNSKRGRYPKRGNIKGDATLLCFPLPQPSPCGRGGLMIDQLA